VQDPEQARFDTEFRPLADDLAEAEWEAMRTRHRQMKERRDQAE
jgi:hypothetical protein